jgi:hypothetical protein
MIKNQLKSQTKSLQAALSSKGTYDTKKLENIFEQCRHDEEKMRKLVRAFCHTYLIDNKSRPLKLRPLQEDIIIKSLTYPEDSNQRKLAILAPRGSGKSFALSVAVVVYMFFNRFRDLIFILAPTEDQAALIFNYVYRHFADNKFLDSLVEGYRFHNKPNITLKGGTIMRRAPLAPTNQGQAIRGQTPKSKDNHMWRYLYDDNYAETFTRLHYTWRDAVKPGDAYAAPYTEEEMLDKMTEWGEDSIHWRTEYECEFVESVSNVFNPEKVKRCCDDYQLIKIDGEDGGERGRNITVAVDIGKSVNSTVISAWGLEKSSSDNIARLVYIEEISSRTGGHDIPYQRKRIMDVARALGADKVIIDATGIGGAIEQDIRRACIDDSIHFIGFVFTGGPKGTKTQMYRDYQSYLQQGRVRVPDPKNLPKDTAKYVNKWIREHIDLEYTMDAANKTEKIAAPSGKHDDYCDSSAMGIHATLSMLPSSGTFGSSNVSSNNTRRQSASRSGYTGHGIFNTRRRNSRLNKPSLSNL